MPRILTQLKINEVSAVDRGAGEGVNVILMKRGTTMADNDPVAAAIEAYLKRNLFTELEALAKIEKREFSADDRKRAAQAGTAMPDGSFPIESKEDLSNAVQAIGRAKNRNRAMAHIKTRAAALGATDQLPAEWKKTAKSRLTKILTALGIMKDGADGDGAPAAVMFEEMQANAEAAEFASGMLSEICEATQSLQQSVCSILSDDSVPDKQAALSETFGQFQEHVQGIVPEGVENAMAAAGLIAAGFKINSQGAIGKGDHVMTEEEKKAAEKEKARADKAELDKAEAEKALATEKAARATAESALAKALGDIAVLKMSADHKKYMEDSDMKGDEKDAFTAKSPAERDDHIKANPVEKRWPAAVQEALAKAARDSETLADLRKKDELTVFSKRAAEIGLPESMAETMMKAHAGDKDALKALENVIKGLNNQIATGKLFSEFGSAQGGAGGGSAMEQLQAKASELRKADPKLSEAAAFSKVYEDRANAELVQLYKRENPPRAA